MKCGIINHDLAKFMGCYGQKFVLKKFETSFEDLLE
jgi:hypothetical protein